MQTIAIDGIDFHQMDCYSRIIMIKLSRAHTCMRLRVDFIIIYPGTVTICLYIRIYRKESIISNSKENNEFDKLSVEELKDMIAEYELRDDEIDSISGGASNDRAREFSKCMNKMEEYRRQHPGSKMHPMQVLASCMNKEEFRKYMDNIRNR